ncbi:MAG: ATPase [Hydrogenophilales bacterium CG03_land_8_20_14_0_80_62_28]|nr:MAG: ATPase [Hydrogenophilaceae bacterium CG1_02_62_390]PIV22599.1 MAG: ATPase [Hydrogenophilales bacterium CG03_land_8_20_14_0_80_62_28]PIW38840.1 MAG: ATPase [Hydrogenophilales bacterium CG15_BIG_FIL_POST_REV_8_21_14_020_62_31]
MRIAGLGAAEALASLNSSASGLDAAEAERRLAEFGPNRLEEAAREHGLLRFARQFSHFFAIVLWLAAGLALFAEHYDPGQGMARLAVAIVAVILVNGVFSSWQEYRAERAVAALRRLLPRKVNVLRGGATIELGAERLVPGDLLLLEEGDGIPADCRVIDAFGLRVNTATVTGESRPKARNAEPSLETSPLEARNLLLAGASLVSGQARAVVYATGMRTEFGRIAHLTQTAGDIDSPLQREIARLSRLVAALAAGLGIVFFLIGQMLGLPFWENMLFAIGIIVANVPEGLLPTVTLALALATQRMARRNVLVRHLPAVEALGSTTVICSDKTGTLTQNRMAARRLWLDGRAVAPDEIAAYADSHRELWLGAGLCHNLRQIDGDWQGDPMEIALAELGRRQADPAGCQRLDEIAFDTDRKRMSVVCATPAGRRLYCKGALETVLDTCDRIQFGNTVAPLDAALRQRLLAAQDAMADAGLRVLAFAWRTLDSDLPDLETGLTLSGLIGLEDPPRPEVAEAVGRCATAGIRVIMVTGDHPRTALAIAREIGLVRGEQPRVMTGEELTHLSPTQLQLALDAPEILFARVAAEQKMRIVEALRKKGEVVAVTGDGVNDAPALKTADIGIAMGQAGTDVAREAADLILLDDNFASLVAGIEEGRAVFDNIRKFLTYILTSNIPEIVPYLAFVLFRIPLPLTVIQILAVDLGTDMLPALALGAERSDPAVMRRPPRARSERLLTWGLVARAYLFLGVLEAAAAMAAFFLVLDAAGWHYGQMLAKTDPLYLQATTACLVAIVAAQVANVFLCRHPTRSIVDSGVRGNLLLAPALAVELAVTLAIVYTPPGHWLFGTASVGFGVWLAAGLFTLAMLGLEEARKAWLRRRLSL